MVAHPFRRNGKHAVVGLRLPLDDRQRVAQQRDANSKVAA
jgi:hypothetical protein